LVASAILSAISGIWIAAILTFIGAAGFALLGWKETRQTRER
jgi:hypothetical protein